MKFPRLLVPIGLTVGLAAATYLANSPNAGAAAAPLAIDWTVVAWNDLGMHCMDSDYAVFSILPPFNTVNAHVVNQNGDLVTSDAGVTLTYKGVADPSGSINLTSAGKTDFWDHAGELFGATPSVDEGLAGNTMPGLANVPQPMHFDPGTDWFTAEGIPITPIDDAGHQNHYPMMRIEARDGSGALRGFTDVVLPVSDEMDCRACHASGSATSAQPSGGWVNDLQFDRDYRLNVLRLHDEYQTGNPVFTSALATLGLNPAGLEATVVIDKKSILCSACHGSNALPGTGLSGIPALTQVMHDGHASALDPITGMTLDSDLNRASCYRCHPGSETRCLRGAMGSAVAADGSMSMQCQACHGDMSEVGDPARAGWFEEPSCQECHTGDALLNNGQIRYETVFEPDGSERVAVNQRFATNPDTPAPGIDLYRFSSGHGDLQCSACHGSTHAIFPSAHPNDNVQSIAVQGHEGTIADCTACHSSMPNTVTGGPHGMHPIGDKWVKDHHDEADDGKHLTCRTCHGTDYRGTELSRTFGPRTLDTEKWGIVNYFEGYEVGCYDCHNGPTTSSTNPNTPPVAHNGTASTSAGSPVSVTLGASDPGDQIIGARIVKQPHSGSVALNGTQATYFPYKGFAGTDSFTFAVDDGDNESNLATITVTVGAGWENFGSGHPGTNGVPALTAAAAPALGTTFGVTLGNSAPGAAPALVLLGETSFYQPTVWEGVLLVKEPLILAVTLPPGGFVFPYSVPSDSAWIGLNQVAQLAVIDPGASAGLAFSEGLRLTFGQ